MYGISSELRSPLTSSHNGRSAVATNNSLETERIIDTLTEILFTLLDELFLSFPIIRESLFIKHYTDISKFLIIHNTNFDSIMMKNFDSLLKIQLKTYSWEQKIMTCILTEWRNLLINHFSMSLSHIEDEITQIIKDNKKNLENLLKLASSHFALTQFKIRPFPRISFFNSFFTKVSESLKRKTLFVLGQLENQVNLKSCLVQRAQVEDLVKKVQICTEWMNFSDTITETLDYNRGQNSLIKCCKRCLKRILISKTLNCTYNGAPGWEITRVFTEVIDGRFNDINILHSKIADNLLYVEVEIWFNKFAGKRIWFSLKIEGTSCRKINFESTVSEIRDFLVVVDSSGAYEINEDN